TLTSSRAAVSPANPAPTTMTSALRFGRDFFATLAVAACAGAAATAPAAADAAPVSISLRRVGRQSPLPVGTSHHWLAFFAPAGVATDRRRSARPHARDQRPLRHPANHTTDIPNLR